MMKDRVVVFTQNNARVLVNPDRIDRFMDKPNAFINPDLTFVNGIEPHFWKPIPNRQMTYDESESLRVQLLTVIDKNKDSDAHSVRFYKALLFILDREIAECRKAADLISKLLIRAHGVEKEDVSTMLIDKLITHSKEPDKRTDNKIFTELIEKWRECTILPMTEDEKYARAHHLSAFGAVNSDVIKPAFAINRWLLYYTALIFVIIAVISFLKR